MVIKKDKKIIKSSTEKEDPLSKRIRENQEIENIKNKKKAEKELEALKEKERMEKLIVPYLDSLVEHLIKNKTHEFFIFTDRAGFKKIKIQYSEMKKLLKENIDKYKNRRLAFFSVCTHHKSGETSMSRELGLWLTVTLIIFNLDNKANLTGNETWGCKFSWKYNDFKITKFTYKFLEALMYPVADHKYFTKSLKGISISEIIKDLKKMKIDISDSFTPLGGANI